MLCMPEKSRNLPRSARWRVYGVALVAMLVQMFASPGCGEPECVDPSGQMGSCCNDDGDCDEELECFESFPAGLCSLECEGPDSCPSGSACVGIDSKSKGFLGYFCLLQCGEGLPECRPGYACTKTSNPEIEVCFPG